MKGAQAPFLLELQTTECARTEAPGLLSTRTCLLFSLILSAATLGAAVPCEPVSHDWF